jgi:hypothetical protein
MQTLLHPSPDKDIQGALPLSEDEKLHLQTIYDVRSRIFYGVYAFFTLFLAYKLLPYTMREAEMNRPMGKGDDYAIFGHRLTIYEFTWFLAIFFGGAFLISGILVYRKKIGCLKRDIKTGYKEPLTFTITRKLYFDTTGECFFSFDHPDYMHYEVDEETYNQASVGDEFTFYQAPYSRHIFEKDNRFTFM